MEYDRSDEVLMLVKAVRRLTNEAMLTDSDVDFIDALSRRENLLNILIDMLSMPISIKMLDRRRSKEDT